MIPEEINRIIGEAVDDFEEGVPCTEGEENEYYDGWICTCGKQGSWADEDHTHDIQPKNYYGDLNAMFEAEASLHFKMWRSYIKSFERPPRTSMEDQSVDDSWFRLHISAAKRAEAFVKAFGQ